MAKAIKDRVSLIKRKREQRQLVREEQEKRKQEESSFKQQVEQQSSASQTGIKQLPSASTGIPTAPTTSASVSTQVEPEEPEADQHQQLQYQQPGISVLCKYFWEWASMLRILLIDLIEGLIILFYCNGGTVFSDSRFILRSVTSYECRVVLSISKNTLIASSYLLGPISG